MVLVSALTSLAVDDSMPFACVSVFLRVASICVLLTFIVLPYHIPFLHLPLS